MSRVEKLIIKKDNDSGKDEWDILVRDVITANRAGPSAIPGLITMPRRVAQMSKKRIHDIFEMEENPSDEDIPLEIRRRHSRYCKRVPAERESESD